MYIALFLIGVIVGIFTKAIANGDKPSGNLVIDDTDPDGPFIFLEATERVETIISKNKVVLKVIHRKNNKDSNERS